MRAEFKEDDFLIPGSTPGTEAVQNYMTSSLAWTIPEVKPNALYVQNARGRVGGCLQIDVRARVSCQSILRQEAK